MLNISNTRQRLVALTIGLFSLVVFTACTGLEGLDSAAAQAIVQNVDSLSGEVTVQFKDGTTTTFNLEDVDVEALGQLIGDSSFQAGDEIEVELDSSDNVLAVTPHVANVYGTINSVDLDANTLTIEAENGIDITLDLTPQTKIELEGNDGGTVNDLSAGLFVRVKYNTETEQALKIKTDDGNDADEDELRGVITAIDNVDHTVTVQEADGVESTYAAHSNTEIKVDGHAPFGDLQVGMQVKIEFDPATLALEEIKQDDDESGQGRGRGRGRGGEDEGEVTGVITDIDEAQSSITVVGENGIAETYTANSDTEIDIDGIEGQAEFGDLSADMHVEIEFDNETLMLLQIDVDTEDEGDDDPDDD